MLCLLSDAVLDLFTSVGVPMILLVTYLPDYSFEYQGFDTHYWYNEFWLVNVLNEFQLILVSSWLDLASRIVFSFGFLGSLQGIKNTLRERPGPSAPMSSVGVSSVSHHSSIASEPTAVVDEHDRLQVVEPPALRRLKTSLVQAFPVLQSREAQVRRATARFFHWFFLVWGLGVFIAHVHAEAKPTLSQCLMQLYPWFQHAPACALLVSDCHRSRHTGDASILATEWLAADPRRTTRLLIRHCPELVMPAELQELRALRGLKIYNSTITSWDAPAALTNAKHPSLMMALLVRVRFQDGLLPAGMLSRDFPAFLWDIELCVTNLRALPDDLDSIWPTGAYYYLELSELNGVPPVLGRVAPSQLSLAGSGVKSFPFEVFDWDGLEYLGLSRNPIAAVVNEPYADISDRGSLRYLYLVDTLVDTLPRWIDKLFERTKTQPLGLIAMTGTPLCAFVREMKSGNRSSFPLETRTPTAERSVVMNATSVTDDRLRDRVSCSYSESLFYPLAWEDKWQQLSFEQGKA
ncbi:hypothetical protein ATCC90586_007508 [Pythium insidiosum]|nr:hypothetical protein ATCC90586_007508 [Pythium insidiosum]